MTVSIESISALIPLLPVSLFAVRFLISCSPGIITISGTAVRFTLTNSIKTEAQAANIGGLTSLDPSYPNFLLWEEITGFSTIRINFFCFVKSAVSAHFFGLAYSSN
jgi:hypothetical protein